ncbi:tRNA (guanine46-N7-)-methyltransferase [Hydrogenimonas sp.]|nr:tRNA (guanine46-N7-)-methyltransferase [Hydrogenimonas sp.]
MPHIRLESFKEPALPFEADGVSFEWFAKNLEHEKEGLIGVKAEGVPFLLQLKPKGDTLLLKGEKITRPSPNTLLKKALKVYMESFAPKVLFSNIANVESARLPKPTEALKEAAGFDPSELPKRPLWIEIGFGSGRHLVYQAKQNPDVHLIGLEIHRPSLEQVMRRIELDKIGNLWVIDYDARLFMELLPSNRVEKIFVHFPVPWDKKPHRRVISDSFLEESLRVLEPGGSLELRTDSENYFRYAMEVFTRPERVKLTLKKNLEAAVRSKYEDRWRRMGKNIYEVHVESLEVSEPREERYDFSFGKPLSIGELFAKKPEKASVESDFFVHFERFYAIDERDGLIRVSFGSFDRPEHKFVLVRGGSAEYYPHAPVNTATNYKAHRMIREWVECAT